MSKSVNASGGIDRSVWKIAMVVLIGSFMTQLDSTVVNVSLPAISRTLGAPLAAAQWVVSGYLLAMALMLPLNGWLVESIGAKRLYLISFSTFTLASVLCGASRTMGELIDARLFQGLAGGVLAPMTQMMIARAAGQNMARVMSYATLPILLAPILGPVLAGGILAHGPWYWLFFLNVPVGMLGVGLAAWMLPADTASLQKRPFDFRGFALISPRPRCNNLWAATCRRYQRTVVPSRRIAISRGVFIPFSAQGQQRAYRCASFCQPHVRRRRRHAIFRQRHDVWPPAYRSVVLDSRLRANRRASGLVYRSDGGRHDVLISFAGVLNGSIRLPRGLGGRRAAGFSEHMLFHLDDGTIVFSDLDRGQLIPGRGGAGHHQHTVHIGGLFFNTESQAPRGEYRAEYCAKSRRPAGHHAPKRGYDVDDTQSDRNPVPAFFWRSLARSPAFTCWPLRRRASCRGE
ncbi:MFS transporter [Acerihabitans sp. KWT182]|uniref:MFS transporter n=1 Tax=Acerihabitans sp. KWT182 TaxID=3157919 RepID=A0AAU7Q9K5_9GAMM